MFRVRRCLVIGMTPEYYGGHNVELTLTKNATRRVAQQVKLEHGSRLACVRKWERNEKSDRS